ncbi:MAG: hypothetical protein GXP42_10425 [Chloroflexi bacterium]|nr:hypothetical protein [Chloroflexota bacterium]
MMKRTVVFTVVLLFALILAKTASAQSPTSGDSAEPWMGEVSGVVINGTEGGVVSPDLEVTLYVWDDNFENKAIRDALLDLDGAFRFSDVPFSPDYNYGVAVTYEEVTYFSEPVKVEPEQTELEVETTIYEVTTDASSVEISRAHIVLELSSTGLEVSQIYVVSNNGDRTVWNALTLDDGAEATLRFWLPPDASNLALSDPQERWIRLPDGFADVSPLLPGENVTMMAASYLLPFEDGMSFIYQAEYPTEAISFIIPDGGPLTVTGDGLADLGVRETRDGAALRLLGHDGAAAGVQVAVQLSGALPPPRPAATENIENPATDSWQAAAPPKPALFAAAALGLALIITGIWWWHFSKEENDEISESAELESIIEQIALLDDDFERGALSEDDYATQREALLAQLRERFAPSS